MKQPNFKCLTQGLETLELVVSVFVGDVDTDVCGFLFWVAKIRQESVTMNLTCDTSFFSADVRSENDSLIGIPW